MGKAGRKKRTDVPWDEVKARYMTSSESIRGIASEFGIPDTTLGKRIRTEGWVRCGEIDTHISARAKIEAQREHLLRKEEVFPPAIKAEVDKRVRSKAEWILELSTIQTGFLEDVMAMWNHDKRVKPVFGEENEAQKYGKAKIVQDVIDKSRKNLLGDAPLIAGEDELMNDDDVIIVVPEQEYRRVRRIEDEDDGAE